MNVSTACARAVVGALLGSGVRHVVLCPGSRSAPLAYALEAAERAGDLALHVRHDERSAGFVALGLSRGGGTAAVVTTSGTAVANLHPAVMEAHHGHVRLLVLSADRPHRLRGTWANQTTPLQAPVFGRAVRWRADLAVPEDGDVTAWTDAVHRAVRETGQGGPGRWGPVHLDLAFDDPLVPGDDAPSVVLPPPPVPRRRSRAGDPVLLAAGPRTVVVAGDRAGPQARWLAEAGGWPLLAEPTSGARSGANAVGPYRLLLEGDLGARVQRVVAFGRPTLSRPVTRLLAREDVEVVLVESSPGQPDPGRDVVRSSGTPVPAELADAPEGFSRKPADAWLAAWLGAGRRAQVAVDAVLDAEASSGRMTGPLVAREVLAATRPHERLVVAASNVVRDLDLAGHPGEPEPGPVGTGPGVEPVVEAHEQVVANRGLSGIDGTLSTAVGLASSGPWPTRALVGDLAFLHDLGGLAVPSPERGRLALQVVVVNDDGGGIFALLEHGDPARAASFERVFGTPHGADLGQLSAGLGARYERVGSPAALRASLSHVSRGVSVVEVRVDRSALRDLHARLRAAVAGAAGGAPGPGSGVA